MGIQDRDYMKGRGGKGGASGSGAVDEALEGLLGDFFRKHKRLVRFVIAVFILLLVIGILLAAFGMQ
jgi:hypothetical protein